MHPGSEPGLTFAHAGRWQIHKECQLRGECFFNMPISVPLTLTKA